MSTDPVETVLKFAEFVKQKPGLYKKCLQYNLQHNYVLAIMEHPRLFYYVDKSSATKYSTITSALNAAATMVDHFIVSFENIGLYCTFNNKSYKTLLDNYNKEDGSDQNPKSKSLQLYQIAIVGTPQKLVFVADTAEYVEVLRKTAEKLFNVTTATDGNQITVNKFSMTEQELGENYVKLSNEVREQLGAKIHNSVHPVTANTAGNISYRTYDILSSALPGCDIAEIIKTLAGSATVINFNIATNGGTINVTNNVKKKKMRNADAVAKWVRENPPGDEESKQNYHARFESSSKIKMPAMTFGKIVSSAGYSTYHPSKDVYLWVKLLNSS